MPPQVLESFFIEAMVNEYRLFHKDSLTWFSKAFRKVGIVIINSIWNYFLFLSFESSILPKAQMGEVICSVLHSQ